MARLGDDELESIIQRDMPGYKVVSRGGGAAAGAPMPEPDEVAPDIDELRAKYLGEQAPGAAAADGESEADAEADEEIVTVGPESTADPFDPGARPKKVIVSANSRRIIGSQG